MNTQVRSTIQSLLDAVRQDSTETVVELTEVLQDTYSRIEPSEDTLFEQALTARDEVVTASTDLENLQTFLANASGKGLARSNFLLMVAMYLLDSAPQSKSAVLESGATLLSFEADLGRTQTEIQPLVGSISFPGQLSILSVESNFLRLEPREPGRVYVTVKNVGDERVTGGKIRGDSPAELQISPKSHALGVMKPGEHRRVPFIVQGDVEGGYLLEFAVTTPKGRQTVDYLDVAVTS